MEEKNLIYVAGNPDAYPLEYYDPESEKYQGVIPALLAEFSAQSGYEVVYYAPGAEDQRAHLGGNRQVDLLSGYARQEDVPSDCEEILLFQTLWQGEERAYYLGVTRAAPDGLGEALEGFFSALPQRAVTGAALESAAAAPPPGWQVLPLAAGGLALSTVLLATALVVVIRRFTRRMRKLQSEAERDEITGLGNFDYLQRYFTQLVHDKNRALYHLVYFYVDTEHLRRFASGQETNEVLRFCAVTLQNQLADTDILAKVSDSGFVALKLAGSPEGVERWVSSLLQTLRAYPQTYAKPFEVAAAAGIYPLKMGDRDLNEMIFNASQEAHRALLDREDWREFSHEALRRVEMEHKLRATVERALETQEFQLYIQFYVDACTHRIVGGEALSRWLHPERGLLAPGEFVPVLEREGLVYKLDYHCLRCSCAFLQVLADRGIEDFFLSCNFSRETFAAPDFVPRCREMIDAYHFPRELLIFELTESVSVKHLTQLRENMVALKDYGVSIALDDFGEGVTSFADLQTYPVDGVKLDKGLIDHVLDRTGNAILRAMIQVGHELGLTILAEGVETEEQARVLREIHCDVIQGFRFYAPVPAAEARDKVLEQVGRKAPADTGAPQPVS